MTRVDPLARPSPTPSRSGWPAGCSRATWSGCPSAAGACRPSSSRSAMCAPDFDTHEIISLVWAQPLLTAAQLALAHWISDYYLAPLIEALRLMLPAGLEPAGPDRARPHPRAGPVRSDARPRPPCWHASPRPRASGPRSARGCKASPSKDDLEPLIARGLVTREVVFPDAAAAPEDRPAGAPAGRRRGRRAGPADAGPRRASRRMCWRGWREQTAARRSRQPGPRRSRAPRSTSAARRWAARRAPVKALGERGWVELDAAGAMRARKSLPQ